MNSNRGEFIVIEGIDGAGKGTQLSLLAAKLAEKDVPFIESKEPTTSPIGKLGREYASGKYPADEITRQCLFVADRTDHVLNPDNGIIHKLRSGIHVIQDRGYLSGMAYGGAVMGWEIASVVHKINRRILRPTLTIVLDIDPEIGMQRISDRKSFDIYETLDQLKSIHRMYNTMIDILRCEGEEFYIINGSLPIEKVAELIWCYLGPMFE